MTTPKFNSWELVTWGGVFRLRSFLKYQKTTPQGGKTMSNNLLAFNNSTHDGHGGRSEEHRREMEEIARKVFAEEPSAFDPRKYLTPARELIKETVKQKGNPITVAAYIGLNQPEDEEIITLVVNAIKNTYPEHDDELNALEALKLYLEEKNLSDDVVTAIKKTRDPETIVCAALCFEKELIKDVFGSKKDMYFYLLANTFTDNENIEFYKERLLQMDNHAFTKSINNSAKRIDQKIKEKKLI